MRYDEVVDAVVATDGMETWILRGSTWIRVETDPSGSGDPAPGFRFDSESGGVAFGGGSALEGGRILTLVNRPSNDCDGDGIADDLQIAAGAADCDHDGVLDACERVALAAGTAPLPSAATIRKRPPACRRSGTRVGEAQYRWRMYGVVQGLGIPWGWRRCPI